MGLGAWIGGIISTGTAALRGWVGSWAANRANTPSSLAPPGWMSEPETLPAPPSTVPTPYPDYSGIDTPPDGPLSPEETAVLNREWHQMASSNVDEVRYIADEELLEVAFLNGYYYQYYNVPPKVFLAFLQTNSPGRFVWNVLRADGYEYARIGSGALPVYETGNVRQTANVTRRLLPEERAATRESLARVPAGTVVRGPRVPLRQANWRRENVRATAQQQRARNRERRGR